MITSFPLNLNFVKKINKFSEIIMNDDIFNCKKYNEIVIELSTKLHKT